MPSRRAGEQGSKGDYFLISILLLFLFAGCQERQIRIHFENAEKHQVAGDLEAAAAEYRAVVEMDSTQVDAQNNLGHLYAKMGQPDSALTHYRLALLADPKFAEAHFNKGVLFSGASLMDSAVASYEATITYDSTHTEAYNNLGALFEVSGKVHAAIDQYSLAVAHRPGFAPGHANLGRAWLMLGQNDRAIQSSHRAIELSAGLIEGYVTLGSAYAQQNDFERSLQYLELAARIAPDDALVRQNLQVVRERQRELNATKAAGQMRAAHIVVDKVALAEVLIQKTKEGEDFSLLARVHSTDPSGRDGGDIGAFNPGDLMPEFENLVRSLRPGQVGGPLKTKQGYHIIKRIY